MKWAPFFVILILSSNVLADGGVYIRHAYESEKLSLLPEDRQIAYINREGESQVLRISVKTDLEGEQAFWILPLPADAEYVEVDVLDDFPKLSGYEVKSKAGYIINRAWPWMLMSQGYPLIIAPCLIWQLGVFSMGGGGRSVPGLEKDRGVTVETHLEKRGLTVEVVEARDWNSLDMYLRKKDVVLPEDSRKIIDEYIGGRYSFVLSWVSNVREYTNNLKGGDLTLKAKFPAKELYYPLRLTAVYGRQRIPVTVYVEGFVSPELYHAIDAKTKTHYFADEDGMKYTRVRINAYASEFQKDLRILEGAPLDAEVAHLLSQDEYVSPLMLYLICSVTAALISGIIIYRRRYPYSTYLKVGLHNLLTIIGVVYAADRLFKDEKKTDKDKTLIAVLLGMPYLAVLAYAANFLIYWVLSISMLTSYTQRTINPAGYVFTLLFGNIVYLAIASGGYLLYRRYGNWAWLIPTAWFGSTALFGIVSGLASLASIMPGMKSIALPATMLMVIYVPLIVSLPIMFVYGLLLGLNYTRKASYCITFTIVFTILVGVSTMAILNVFPPKTVYHGIPTATGFSKIKPQLAGTGVNRDGEFIGIFTNGVGISIVIEEIEVEDYNSGMICEGEVFEYRSRQTTNKVLAGDNFQVKAAGCGFGESGDPYELKVTIHYNVSIGDATVQQEDSGFVRGAHE